MMVSSNSSIHYFRIHKVIAWAHDALEADDMTSTSLTDTAPNVAKLVAT